MEIVQSLSATKQRKSLGGTKKRELNSKKPTRTTVVAPTDIDWPDVSENVEVEILDVVQRTVKCLVLPVRKCPLDKISPVGKSERAEFRRNWIAEQNLNAGYDYSVYITKRAEVCIGVNCCSMSMEQNGLVGLIIEKNVEPQILTKLLVPIARNKQVPVISLKGFSLAFKNACGFKCIAFGFKEACRSPASDFHSLLELVEKHSPKTIPIIHQFPQDSSCPRNAETKLPASTLPTLFSIEQEIQKLENKAKSKLLQEPGQSTAAGGFYIPTKIRKMQPKNV